MIEKPNEEQLVRPHRRWFRRAQQTIYFEWFDSRNNPSKRQRENKRGKNLILLQ